MILCMVLVWLAGCSSTVTAPETVLEQISPELDVLPLWYRQPQSQTDSPEVGLSPFVAEGRLFFAELGDRLISLDAATGHRVWASRLHADPATGEVAARDPGRISGGIGAGTGQLYVGTSKGEVIALDPEDGAQRWRVRLTSEVLVPPRSRNGIVVVRTGDGRIYALDAEDGRRLWVYAASMPPLSLRGSGTPVMDAGRVFVGFANGRLVALSLDSGEVLWEATVTVPEGRSELERLVDVDGTPAPADGVVYAAAYQGRLVSVSQVSGRVLWARDIPSHHDLVVEGETLYVTADDGRVLALDRNSGTILWNQDKLTGRGVTGPVVHGDTVVVADARGYLHWLAPDDGRFLARHRVDTAAITEPPFVAGEVLYVASSAGTLQAVKVKGRK